jgi:transposase
LQLPLKAARKHPVRQELPADLPRVEQLITCTPQQCVCGKCGKQTTVIGYESSEQLDVEPAKYFARVTKHEKRAKNKEYNLHRCQAGSSTKAWPVIGW